MPHDPVGDDAGRDLPAEDIEAIAKGGDLDATETSRRT